MKKNTHLLIFLFCSFHAVVILMTYDHKIHKLDTATCTWMFCKHFECRRSVIFRKMSHCTKPTMLNEQSRPASDTKSMQRANKILVSWFFFQPNKSFNEVCDWQNSWYEFSWQDLKTLLLTKIPHSPAMQPRWGVEKQPPTCNLASCGSS